MMRYDGSDTHKTYATFRVSGDTLDPDIITKILRVIPTISYAKGEKYFAGQRTGELIGKTGMWSFTTDKLVASNNLQHHLAYVLGILIPGRQDASPLVHLHALLAKNKGIRADLRCFWHGHASAKKPSIPKIVTEFVKIIPASIEADFDTDSVSDNGRKTA
ncbi:MAG: DUF4279 domain-containing protein [Terriglobia bacterium]